MTPQELKNSILQLAIQGKLVEPNIRDFPVDLSAIKQKKTDDYEFELPDNWRLAHLESITKNIPSKQYQILESQVLADGRFPVISQSKAYSIGFSNEADRVYHHDRPVIIFGDHTTEVKFVEFDFVVGADGVKIFEPIDDIIVGKFLFYIFQFYSRDLSKIGGYSRHYKYIKNKPFPLPPLAEQKRIVAKIEELLPHIDRYEHAWSKLEQFNSRFPEDMKKSLLQYAIQGKLVEQRPEEGTAEELYQKIQKHHVELKPCKDDLDFSAMNFEIPATWKVVELNQLYNFIDYRGKTPIKSAEGVFLVTASNIKRGYMDYTRKEYISFEEYGTRKSRGITQKGDLLFTTEAPMGNAAICDLEECSCGQRIITFQEYEKNTAIPELFMYFILSPQFQKQLLDNCTGTTAKGIKADKLKHLIIPLPPLAEQKRIVEKLEQLLPLCERLK